MNGMLIKLVENQLFTFSSQPSATTVTVINQGIEVLKWKRGRILARIHGATITDATATIAVTVENVWPFPSSSARFNEAASAGSVTIAFANPQPSGILMSAAINGDLGPVVDVSVQGAQGANGGALDATLSLALQLWDV